MGVEIVTWADQAEFEKYLADFPASRGMTADELLAHGEATDWEDGEVWEWAALYCHERDKALCAVPPPPRRMQDERPHS